MINKDAKLSRKFFRVVVSLFVALLISVITVNIYSRATGMNSRYEGCGTQTEGGWWIDCESPLNESLPYMIGGFVVGFAGSYLVLRKKYVK